MKSRYLLFILFLLLSASTLCTAQTHRLDQFFNDLRTAKNDTQRIIAYNHIAIEYRYLNPDTAVTFAMKGLSMAKKMNYRLGEAKSLGNLGIVYEMLGNFDLSKEYLLKAMSIFQELNYVPGIANSYNELGTLSGRKGDYDTATRYFLKAEKIEEETHDLHGLMQTYMKLGVTNEESDNLDEALDYYQKLLKLNEIVKDNALGSSVLNNIGVIYGKKDDYRTALQYFQRALSADSLNQDQGTFLQTYINFGIIYGKMGDIDKALKYQNQVLQMARDRHLPEEECKALINLASLYERKDPAKSEKYLDEARAIAERGGQKDMILSIMATMVAIDKRAGRYKEALDLLEKQRDLSNEIFSLKKAKEIGNLQATYELEKSKNKVQQLEIANRKNEFLRNVILTVTFFVIIIVFILAFFYAKTKKLNSILTKQKEELKELNLVKDKLFSVIGHDLRTPMAGIVSTLSVWDNDDFSEREKSDVIEHLKKQGAASLDTLDKLLYWGQAQLKGIRLHQLQMQPIGLVQKNIDLVEDAAKKKNITIINKISNDISVYVDPDHFDFVVRNLLSNAIKFSYAGGTIEINAIHNMPKGFTTFAVKDSGTGIPKDLQHHIFNLSNESVPGTANEKGTSIGLTLCKEYINENGGDISVESEPGKGSVFYFTLKNSAS